MPLPVITNVWRIAINWQAPSQTAVNVIHILDTGGMATAANLATILDGDWQTGQFETVSSSATITGYDIIKLDGSSATVHVSATGPSGTGGSEFIPAASVLVSFGTGLRGRDHRGRLYLPFTAETKQNDGVVSVSSFSALETAWVNWATALATDNIPLQVASYKDAASEDVITATVRSTLATQRRRQQRVS